MTNKNSAGNGWTEAAEYEQRIRACADVGQVVRVEKDKCLRHYEGLLAELGQGSSPHVRA
jgi:hypothetical protein